MNKIKWITGERINYFFLNENVDYREKVENDSGQKIDADLKYRTKHFNFE